MLQVLEVKKLLDNAIMERAMKLLLHGPFGFKNPDNLKEVRLHANFLLNHDWFLHEFAEEVCLSFSSFSYVLSFMLFNRDPVLSSKFVRARSDSLRTTRLGLLSTPSKASKYGVRNMRSSYTSQPKA